MLTVDFDRLAVRTGDIVLDAGCGYGRHSLEFVSRGAVVYSMDMDMECLRKTRFALMEMKRHPGVASLDCLVHSGDALNLPYKDESFDRVICAEVMEHVGDDGGACRELARVLKRNGRIAITVPTLFSERIYNTLTFEYFSSPGGHIRKYHPRELAALMRQNGLEVYAVGFKHAFHTVWWMIRCVVGLHRGDQIITRAYHRFLHLGLYSRFMRKAESFFNYLFPKSVVIYAWKK
jgi:ubiquinone/menaquinone biosynthesis C-methylase UbiE